MTPARWQRIKGVLADALELQDATDRRAYVERACADDAQLRRDVESLLAREATGLDRFAEKVGGVHHGTAHGATQTGRRLGAYELTRELGRGGMGTVYLARRADGRFEQQVAVKLLKRGTDTEEVLRRFRAERRILARLEHPNIARLLDGGETEDGLPFLVMEYVDGAPLTAFAQGRSLSIRARLELFGKVCAAVQFAHQNLVVHRDLKPGNILVTAEGEPKLLDFGLAKLIEPEEGDERGLTITMENSRRLTPAYASPEQVRGATLTTASDVYALGALLYELLTGVRPHRFSGPHPPPVELLRVVGEEEPLRPSLAASPESRPRLRGDLDNIVGLAMRKDPARRYQSVGAFAEDLRRHLESRPVRARRDTARYRTAKFIGRNKTGVAIGGLVFLALTAAVVISLREARQAQRRFNDVRTLAHSFLFDFHDAIRDLPGSTPARRLLVTRALAYLERLEREAGNDAGLKRELAQAYLRVGDVQGRPNFPNLNDVPGAVASYRRAVAIAETLPQDDASTVARADAWASLGDRLAFTAPTRPEALRLIRRALQVREARLAARPADPDARRAVTISLLSLGDEIFDRNVDERFRRNDAVAAESTYLRGLALADGLHTEFPANPDDTRTLARLHYRLGNLYYILGRGPQETHDILARGLEHHLRSVGLREENLAAHPAYGQMKRDLADGLTAKAIVQTLLGDPAEALAGCRRATGLFTDLVSADPDNHTAEPDLAFAFYNTIYPLRAMGDLRGAIESADRVVAIYGSFVDRDPTNLGMVSYLGGILRLRTELCRELGDLKEAQASARRWLQCAERLSAATPTDDALCAELALARTTVRETGQP